MAKSHENLEAPNKSELKPTVTSNTAKAIGQTAIKGALGGKK